MTDWRAVIFKIEPKARPWIVNGLVDAMPDLITKFHISTPLRQMHFLSQCAWESDHFNTTQEYATGNAYNGRRDLGNTHPGDGPRFKGRGLIQLTGRANYAYAAQELDDPGILDDPTDVWRFPRAATVSGWFWNRNGLNELADKDDVVAVTKRVNGGINGLDGREAALGHARTALA